MRAHLIENGKVANTIEVESLDFLPGLIDAALGGSIGDSWDGESFTAPVPPAPAVPQSISPLQGLLALDAAGLADDYERWAGAPERTFAERAFINRAQVWRRDDPLLQAAIAALGMTAAQGDQLFIMSAAL